MRREVLQRFTFHVLPFHQIDFFDAHRIAAAVDSDDEGQANRGLGGGHGDDKDGKYLTADVRWCQVAPEGHEVDVNRVEHQLNTHQNGHSVAPRQCTV